MKSHDPFEPPDPQAWMELDESERITLVLQYHERKRVELPNPRLHAVAHVIVENQVALGERLTVEAVLARPIREGLDRHDAVHDIGRVLMGVMHDVQTGKLSGDPTLHYSRQLDALTARKCSRKRNRRP